MKMTKGLLIPIHVLETASGISKEIIRKDIEGSVLNVQHDAYVWYRDALVYVFKKWNEGKAKMYPPYSENPDQSFAARVLSLMDDEITANRLNIEWKDEP